MRQEVHKNSTEFILCWPPTAGQGPLSVVNLPSENPLEKSTPGCLLGGVGAYVHFPPPRDPAWLNLCVFLSLKSGRIKYYQRCKVNI